MKNIQVFILLIFFCFACNERKPDAKQVKPQEKTIKTESGNDFKGVRILKSVLDEENLNNNNNSVKILDKDSIDDMLFIRELFPTEEIDSIEMYGEGITQKTLPLNSLENSLLIIYFNQKRLAKNQLNLIQYEWNDRNKFAQAFYEKGGITFELDGQLFLYPINSCLNNGNSIESIDSKIKAELNKNAYSYERIITTCGKVLFERKMN